MTVNGFRRNEPGKTPFGMTRFMLLLLLVTLAFASACTLRLEDRVAPSARISLEVDYNVTAGGLAPTPPEVKHGEGEGGNAFRVRTAFDNTFISYDAEGSFIGSLEEWGLEVEEEIPAAAKGWGYRGSLLVMPGWSVGDDRFFIAPLVGLDLSILDMDLRFPEAPEPNEGPFNIGRLTVPLGFRIETTIAHMVTPSFTWYWAPSVSEWEMGLPGADRVGQLAARLWLGSLTKALGDHAWIEAGYRMTTHKSKLAVIDIYDFRFDGPFVGFGFTF